MSLLPSAPEALRSPEAGAIADFMADFSELESAMALLLNVFGKYASLEGRTDTLSRKEVKTLIENEFPHFLKVDTHLHPDLCL